MPIEIDFREHALYIQAEEETKVRIIESILQLKKKAVEEMAKVTYTIVKFVPSIKERMDGVNNQD